MPRHQSAVTSVCRQLGRAGKCRQRGDPLTPEQPPQEKLESADLAHKRIVHVCGEDGRRRSNAAWLVCAFMVLRRSARPTALAPGSAYDPSRLVAPAWHVAE